MTIGADAVEKQEGLAIVLGGGAARGAYQAGVLRSVADSYPDLRVSILTGVSSGAINAVYLASRPGNLRKRAHQLCDLWAGLEVEEVFKTDLLSLARHSLRWTLQLALLGGRKGVPNVRDAISIARGAHRVGGSEARRRSGGRGRPRPAERAPSTRFSNTHPNVHAWIESAFGLQDCFANQCWYRRRMPGH